MKTSLTFAQDCTLAVKATVKPRGFTAMTLHAFIKANRVELDAAIRRVCPNIKPLNDEERRLWILNDEGLYLWARSEGVRI